MTQKQLDVLVDLSETVYDAIKASPHVTAKWASVCGAAGRGEP